MPIASTHVILYAAGATDYKIALGAAAISGIPTTNVTGDFAKVWNIVQGGSTLVIAVGGAALNALYYNPCGWTNPSGQAAGHSPFDVVSTPKDTLPGANYFINAAGASAADTLQIACAMAYYAVTGSLPRAFHNYPHPIAATEKCVGEQSVPCPCHGPANPAPSSAPVPPTQSHSVPYWGVDSAAAVSASFYQCVVQKYGKPTFWGRYIKEVRGVSDGLSQSEITFMHQNGVRIMPIYNNFGNATGRQSGVTHAQEAISAARALSMPQGTVIFADIEVNYPVDSAWIQGFVDTMANSPFLPGLYHNPINGGFSSAYCQAVANDPKMATTILWSNEREPGVTTKANAPRWNPAAPACKGKVLVWQYGENGTACAAGIDTNLMDPSLMAHLW